MQNLQNDFMFESLYCANASVPSQEKLYEEATINSKKIFTCLVPDCGKTFKFKSEMERHSVTHTGQRAYACSFPGCGKTFKRNDALINHSKTHSRTVLFSCPEAGCDAQFTTKSAARYHLLRHKGEKTFMCNFPGCTKTFLTYAQLKQHEKAAYYHQKVGIAYSTCQSSPVQESVQEMDGVSPMNNCQIFGLDSVDGMDASDFADIDFEEIFNNPMINEPVKNDFSFPSNNSEVLETKLEEMTTMSNSLAGLENTSAGNLGKRNLQERLIDILDYVIEENKQLKKKLKYNTETVQNNSAERDQLMNQNDIDLFFRSPFGSDDDDDDKNSEISNRYFF